jgi:hypothetical protein
MTEIASDRIGTSVLFENDRVRVWEMPLEPGTSSALHQHHNDYVVIYAGDSELEIAFDGQEPYRRSFDSGYVGYFVVGAAADDDVRREPFVSGGSSRKSLRPPRAKPGAILASRCHRRERAPRTSRTRSASGVEWQRSER